VDQIAQDQYGKLFEKPLTETHLAALAAIFGWKADDSEEVRSVDQVVNLCLQ
jgi:hypothetical protein